MVGRNTKGDERGEDRSCDQCGNRKRKRCTVCIVKPAIVAKPPNRTAWSSEVVIVGISGIIISGASLIPTKIFAAAFIDYPSEIILCSSLSTTVKAYFSSSGVQTLLHQPSNLTDHILHHTQIVQSIDERPQKNNDGSDLEDRRSGLKVSTPRKRAHFEDKEVICIGITENESSSSIRITRKISRIVSLGRYQSASSITWWSSRFLCRESWKTGSQPPIEWQSLPEWIG